MEEELNLGIYDTEDGLAYLGVKGLLALLYTDDFDKEFEYVSFYTDIESPNLLVVLEQIIKGYIDMFDKDMKENVTKIISYFRFEHVKEHPENRKEVFDISNRLLELLRTANDRKMIYWISEQVLDRFRSRTYAIRSIINPNDAIDYMKLLNVDDFQMLIVHSNLVDEEEFKEFIKDVSGMDYIACINILINEEPELLTDPTFIERVRYVSDKVKRDMASSTETYDEYPIKIAQKIYKKYEKGFNTSLRKIGRTNN